MSGFPYVVPGTGFGTNAPGTTDDPTTRGLLNAANESAWRSFMGGGNPTADLEANQWQSRAAGRQMQLGDVADANALTARNRQSSLWETVFPIFQQYAAKLPGMFDFASGGGTMGGSPGIDAILAPLIRQQAEARQRTMNEFSSSGREIGGNTAFQNLVAGPQNSRFGEDLASAAIKASIAQQGARTDQFRAMVQALQAMQGQFAPLFQMLSSSARA